MLVNHKHRGI